MPRLQLTEIFLRTYRRIFTNVKITHWSIQHTYLSNSLLDNFNTSLIQIYLHCRQKSIYCEYEVFIGRNTQSIKIQGAQKVRNHLPSLRIKGLTDKVTATLELPGSFFHNLCHLSHISVRYRQRGPASAPPSNSITKSIRHTSRCLPCVMSYMLQLCELHRTEALLRM